MKIDSKIVLLDNQRYLVNLKKVAVKGNKKGKNPTKIKAFVKKL